MDGCVCMCVCLGGWVGVVHVYLVTIKLARVVLKQISAYRYIIYIGICVCAYVCVCVY